jgi:hypothetical protein
MSAAAYCRQFHRLRPAQARCMFSKLRPIQDMLNHTSGAMLMQMIRRSSLRDDDKFINVRSGVVFHGIS